MTNCPTFCNPTPAFPGPEIGKDGSYWQDPTLYPPPEREPIDLFNYVPIPAAAGGQATIVSQLIEPGYNAIIRAYGNNFVGGGWAEGTGDITWAILIDSAAVPGYDLILGSLGQVSNPTYHPCGFRVMEGQTVVFQVTNNAVVVAGQLTGARLIGYYYPKEYDDPSRGANP